MFGMPYWDMVIRIVATLGFVGLVLPLPGKLSAFCVGDGHSRHELSGVSVSCLYEYSGSKVYVMSWIKIGDLQRR